MTSNEPVRGRAAIPSLTVALAGVLALSAPAAGQPCCDPDGPFRLGEAYADEAATCETLGHWADRAPRIDGRITMTVKGALAAVQSDGALAYLVMCPAPGVQVMCVTYSTNGMVPGDVVLFAGGYGRLGPTQVVLDPCLATRG